MNANSTKPTPSKPIDSELHWIQLAFEIAASLLAEVETALYSIGALSITLKDAADQPLLEPAPGETPLWDTLIIEAVFDSDIATDLLIEKLQQQLPLLNPSAIKTTTIANQAWERVWMDRFKPMCFGKRLWIYPSHIQAPDDGCTHILLDPGLAFGTGTHPTTALCLQWLDTQDLSAKTVLDYGCGSGILSIAAGKLGAKQIYAVDIDPQALQATQANAELNQLSALIETFTPNDLPAVKVDIVLANIISSILIKISPLLVETMQPSADLVLSGILPEQTKALRQTYDEHINFNLDQQLEEWCLLAGKKRR